MSLLETEIPEIEFRDCVEELDFESNYNGQKVDVRLMYLPIREGKIDTFSFLQFVKKQVLVKFVLSCSEVKKQYRRRDRLISDEILFEKALRKFSRSTAKGKLGELILFLFIEALLKAPKIISKISTLDDSNTHVKGADAVHAQFDDSQNLVLYLGESKMYKAFYNACTNTASSLTNTIEDYQTEFDLVETMLDFSNITDELEARIISILDPYENEDITDRIHMPCFIGFVDDICGGLSDPEDYLKKYLDIAQDRIDTFFRLIDSRFDQNRLHLFLLPFESIDDFTDEFISVLGVE